MKVRVELKLDTPPTLTHKEGMYFAASQLTNNESSIDIYMPESKSNLIVAEFTIQKARQIDVVDKIGKKFWYVEDYSDSSIRFPK
jgi:hypothetical protein